jgi:hypothetical protein
MKYSMLIKCDKCGYENFPQHRFCGMCAAELTIPHAPVAGPAARSVQPAAAPKPAIRPAVVKLEHAPVDARSLSYLLDDEPPPRRGRYVWLLVLLLVGGAAAWHWREDLGTVVARISGSGMSAAGEQNSSASTAPSSSLNAAPTTAPGTTTEPPKTGTATDAQEAPAQQGSTPPAANTGDSAQSSPDHIAPSTPAQSDAQAETPETTSAPPPSSPVPQARSAHASAPTAVDMEAEGEKYLYGDGVPENCGRARKNLLTAAGHSNAKAQNVLGTMYATGHCATRDLPTAYRWFGRSLRQDPGNSRIEQDLKVLWNQMTPEERQVALRNHP